MAHLILPKAVSKFSFIWPNRLPIIDGLADIFT